MGSCFSADHIAEDLIHTVHIEEHNRSTALEWSVIYYWGGGGLKHVLLDPNLALSFCSSSKHLVSMKVS